MVFIGGGDGAMALAIREHDWATNPIGPVERWPTVLRTTVNLILDSRFPQCIVWGPGLVTIPNDAFLPILGRKPDALGRSFADVWSEAWHEIGPIAERAFAGEATYIENYPMLTDRFGRSEETHFTFCYSPIRDEDGTVLGMLDTVTETSATVRAERQLQIHNKELGHRLKNTLAVTQAVALQTLGRATDLAEARGAISERLAALGRATDLLTATSWHGADLEALAHAALAAHDGPRIAIAGPPVELASQHAISVALCLHELATNAAKYGALSVESGTVALQWETAGGRLVLTWRERGGPAVAPPSRRGFGSTLIERTLRSAFRGDASLDFRPDGLVFSLDAPWPDLAPPSDAG